MELHTDTIALSLKKESAMKAPKFNVSIWLAVAIALLALPLLSVSPADASSIGRPYIGYTQIKFDPEFIKALEEAGVQIKSIKPGFLNLKHGIAIFPIAGGGVDLDIGNLVVEILHTGGLSFVGQDGMSVDVFNFIISNIVFKY